MYEPKFSDTDRQSMHKILFSSYIDIDQSNISVNIHSQYLERIFIENIRSVLRMRDLIQLEE